MLSEERIETTSFPKLFDLQAIFGLDTAGEHRLLDQPILFETNCQVARNVLFRIFLGKREMKRLHCWSLSQIGRIILMV